MASTLACIGLDVADLDALGAHLEQLPGELVGLAGGVETVRYEDASGSRVTIGRLDGGVVDLVPSYAAPPGAVLSALASHGDVTQADVVASGETVTRFSCDLEQARHLPDDGLHEASVVALGVEMSVHVDAAAFAASDASVLGAGESFVSYGGEADPSAFLAGTVLTTQTHTHAVTGQVFHAVRVRTVGFEATVCLAASEHPTAPEPGNLVAGLAYVVADVPGLWALAD